MKQACRGYNPSIVEDRFQSGCIGMTTAIKKFEVEQGNRFSSYATWWIKQAIFRANHKSRTVELPENKFSEMSKLNKTKNTLTTKLEKEEPTGKRTCESQWLDC